MPFFRFSLLLEECFFSSLEQKWIENHEKCTMLMLDDIEETLHTFVVCLICKIKLLKNLQQNTFLQPLQSSVTETLQFFTI